MTDTPARPRKTTLSRPAPLWEASTWGPYFDALFPPQEVSPWIARKLSSTGVGIARRLWDQREQRRGEYEDMHGTDRARWPVQHPGVVLDAVPSTAHGACLGCQWLDVRGHWMGHSDWFERAPTHIVKCCYYPAPQRIPSPRTGRPIQRFTVRVLHCGHRYTLVIRFDGRARH